MRTSVFLILLNSFGLLCVSSAIDISLGNFNSSVDLIEEHTHVHLDNDEATKKHDNETYVTENPHKSHEKSTTLEHKHKTPEFQNTEPEIIDFFRAASEGAVYDEDREKNHEPVDAHGIHVHHMPTDDEPDRHKLFKAPSGGSHMGHPTETGHDEHATDQTDDMMGVHDSHDDHDHHKKMNNTGSMHDMMMMMYFHTGVKETILFKEWKITTVGGLLGSMVGIFLLAILYEGLKYYREHLFKKYVSSIQFSTVAVTGQSGRVTQVHKVERHHMMSWPHAVQTLLHVVQIVMSYFLMLIFMTYNVWLCLAVVIGAGLGYFVFGWKKAAVVDITEHCH